MFPIGDFYSDQGALLSNPDGHMLTETLSIAYYSY